MSTAAAKAQTAQDQKSADETKVAPGSENKTKEIETPEQISTLQEYQDAVARFRANRTRDPEDVEQTEEARAPREDDEDEKTDEQDETQTDAEGEETDEETDEEKSEAETEEEAETQDGKEKDDDEDEDEEAGDTLPKRIRLTNLNKVDAEALLISRRAGISLEEAIPLAKRKLGIADTPKTEGDAKKPDTEEKSANGLPGTIEQTQAHIEKLKAERKTAFGKDLNFERTAELDEQIDQAREHLASLKETKIRAEVQQQQQFEHKITESKTRAIELYPDVTNPKSELVAKMKEIDATLKETGNPLFEAPEKYLKVAQMAANELGIAPRSKGKPKTDAKVVQERKPATDKKVQPVSGNARSKQADPITELSGQLNKVSSIEDYQNFAKTVLPALRKTRGR